MVFFVKQKTAYEMRISDWSSDVCSSDLIHRVDGEIATKRIGFQRAVFVVGQDAAGLVALVAGGDLAAEGRDLADLVAVAHVGNEKTTTYQTTRAEDAADFQSEEHTSELQSLMRISSAVFCLQKKKTNNNTKKQESTIVSKNIDKTENR